MTISVQWHWNWEALCGEEGFKIWSPERHDFGMCFQQLCFHIPALFFLAISSAYYFGKQGASVVRVRIEMFAINIRCLLVLFLTFFPLIQIYIALNKPNADMHLIQHFLCAVQGVAWFTHFIYNLALRKKLTNSPRGPILVGIIWSLIFTLSVVLVRSHYILYIYSIQFYYNVYLGFIFSICSLIIQLGYALTLIPYQGNATYLDRFNLNSEISETQQLLVNNAYVRFSEEDDPMYLGIALENVGWFSRLLFSWVNTLMDKGVQGKLNNSDDLYDLPLSLNCGSINNKFNTQLEMDKGEENRNIAGPNPRHIQFSERRIHKHSLFIGLHRCFWVQFYSVGILKFIADCSGFAGPMLLNKLVHFIEDKSEPIHYGYIYSVGLVSTTILSSFCDAHFNFLMALVGFKIRTALVSLIYRKVLSVQSPLLSAHFSTGEIFNLMSTDTDRIVNSCPSFHALWSIPFQLVVTLYLLYTQVGITFMAGLLFGVLLIPINKLIANRIGHLSTELMKEKDYRIKALGEVFKGIRTIKLYVWEQFFSGIINKKREYEIKYLKKRKYLDALCVYFWASTPVIISILTFGTYVLAGNRLTAATVFTGIALLNMLISPLNSFPWVLNGITEAWVSIKRIQRLLDLPNLDLNNFYDKIFSGDMSDNAELILSNANFKWYSQGDISQLSHFEETGTKGKGKGKRLQSISKANIDNTDYIFKLCNFNLKIKKGEFVGIIGPTGSGKSSLLSAILGELSKDSGSIAISDIDTGFGYVSQQIWLQHGTVKENILFGQSYDDVRYKTVIHACGLLEDLTLLPAGDMTGIGDSGSTLSGGQKVRIALARAVYQNKNCYLLDDILSAIDPKVAKHIFQHCLMGLLLHKTRLLCTHNIRYLVYANRIGLLEKGLLKIIGKPADVLHNIDATLPVDLELEESISSSGSTSLMESLKLGKPDDCPDKDSTLLGEQSNSGSLEFGVYSSYWKAVGHVLSFMIIVSVVLMQASRNITDWWLAHWVTNAENNSTNSTNETYATTFILINKMSNSEVSDSYSYLKVYIGLACLNTILTLLRAFIFAYGGIVAARKFHKLLFKSIIKAKCTFFDITPTGRIMNRFSSDTYTIDDSLPFILNIFLAQFFGLLGSMLITVYGLPWICLVLVPLIPVYHWIQNHYRLTSRELKRISSVSLSPVYSHFHETLEGLATIRATRAVSRFCRENENHIESNLKALFASQATASWLGLRLRFISVAIISAVSFVSVIQHQYDVADPGLIGLAISYALSITDALGGVVNAFTETERELVAVERVQQYINKIQPETVNFVMNPPFAWPSQGVISFNQVVLKYREYLPPSLRSISFSTRPCEKIGIVGRTGSGKSSILAALYRLSEISSGSIQVDTVDIKTISVSTLRSRMFCIPQEPFLFSSSIKENLDPLNEFRENELWYALEKVNLSETVRIFGGLLQKMDGSNFSAGEKQLFCLARAVLHNSKIICIDEATANIDEETERYIQYTVRMAFRQSTVLTIAHRIQTILDSDRVLVMNGGEIVEFDSPENLLENRNSFFYKLVHQE